MMKRLRFLILALLAVGTCDLALARPDRYSHHAHTRTHVGVYVGPSVAWRWHYPGPYGYPSYGYPSYAYPSYAYPSYGYPPYYSPYVPPVVVVPAAPPSYIERALPAEGQPAQPSPNDWYYCRSPEGYYPYVRTCPGGWQRVPAQPQQ